MPRPRWLKVLAAVGMLMLLATACPADDGTNGTNGALDDELVLGYILPETGQLAFLGPPMIAGVRMAVEEIEEAGGPLGLPVRLLTADEAGDAAVASEAADRHLADGAHAIIGAAASGMSRAIIDQVTGAGVVQCSPSNTSAEFTEWDDDGFYIRTAPPDVLQGQVLAEVILEDNRERVALVSRADGYGRGLMESTAENLRNGGAEVVYEETYDPDAATFDAEVSGIQAANPDAVVLITFEEGATLHRGLIEAGRDPDTIYGADGNASSGWNETVDPANPNAIDGFKGTQPTAQADPGFNERLQEFQPDLEDLLFGPQSYDCVMLIALAVVAGESTDGESIRDNIVGLTRGDNECSGFQECAELLQDGETIQYRFVSGTEDFRDEGEPNQGTYEVWEWTDGEWTSIDERFIQGE